MNEQQLILPVAVLIGATGGVSVSYILHKNERPYYRMDTIPNFDAAPNYKVPTKINKTGIKKEMSKIINEFVSTMKLAGFDVRAIYESLSKDSIEMRKGTDIGTYKRRENRLIVDPDDIRSTLLRGLLEMCVSKKYTDFEASGFERTTYDEEQTPIHRFGYGLNEGYKDIILKRYFDVPYRYHELADLANLIELAIGKKKMETYFSRGDIQNWDFALSREYRTTIDSTHWAMGEHTIFKMDRLYTKLYRRGMVGTIFSQKEFSGFLADLIRLATLSSKRKYDSALRGTSEKTFEKDDVLWESPVGDIQKHFEWQCHEERQEMLYVLRTSRNILNKYRNPETRGPKIREEDYANLCEFEKQKLMLPVSLTGVR